MNVKSKSTLIKFENNMRVKNYSSNTIKIYSHYCGIFLSNFESDFYHISIKNTIIFL